MYIFFEHIQTNSLYNIFEYCDLGRPLNFLSVAHAQNIDPFETNCKRKHLRKKVHVCLC